MRRQQRRPAPERRSRSLPATEHAALALQRVYGNRALQRLASDLRTAVQREDEQEPEGGAPGSVGSGLQEQVQQEGGGAGESTLTPDEEKEWLEEPPIVQGAWTGRRQLTPLRFLGRPWVVNKSSNIANLRLYHEHMFFEDSASPSDLGHMGPQGVGPDPLGSGPYSQVLTGLDDAKLRRAVQMRGNPGPYSLLSNNCQDYVQSVLRIYRGL